MIQFSFTVVNITGFVLENVQLSLQTSLNLQIFPNESESNQFIGTAQGNDEDFGGGISLQAP